MKDGVTPKQVGHGDRTITAMLSRYSSGERVQRAFSHPSFETEFFKLLDQLSFDPTKLLERFRFEYYQKFLGFDCPDLTQLVVPVIRAQFNWVFPIVAIHDQYNEALFQALKKRFPCWKWTDQILDEWVVKNDRDPSEKPYVIRTRDRIEADEEFKNFSAIQVAERKILAATLYERQHMEGFYYMETGQHLDIQNLTLVAGSLDSDGDVPYCYWGGGEFRVDFCRPDFAGGRLRVREVEVS